MKKDDPFYVDEFPSAYDIEEQWRYYIASYTSLEDTEGVDKKLLTPVVLARNVHARGVDPKSDTFPPLSFSADAEGQDATAANGETQGPSLGDRLLSRFLAARNDERLIMRIAVNNYHPIFQPGTAEGFYEEDPQREGGGEGVKMAVEAAKERELEKFVARNEVTKGLSEEVVREADEVFDKKVGTNENEGVGESMEVDG